MALTKIDDRGLKTPVDLLDSEKIRLGTGNDLEIFHDGSNSYIKDTGTGDLNIAGSIVRLQSSGGETLCRGVEDGAFELYHNNSLRLETTSSGISVPSGYYLDIPHDSGKIRLGAGNDLEIYHDGSNSRIKNNTGWLGILADQLDLTNAGNNDLYFKGVDGGAASLYWDGSKKLETTSYGNASAGQLRVTSSNATTPAFSVGDSGTGFYNAGTNAIGYSANGTQKWNIDSLGNLRLVDNVKANFGTGDDLQIYHDGSNTYLDNTTGVLHLRVNGNENALAAVPNAEVALYYDESKKFETTDTGAAISGLLAVSGSTSQTSTFTGNGVSVIHSSGSNIFIGTQTGTDGKIAVTNNADLHFRTNNTERLRIISDGKVVIGGNYTNSGNFGRQVLIDGTLGLNNDSGTVGIGFSKTHSNTYGYIGTGDWAVNGAAADDFGITSGSTGDLLLGSAATERLRITADGFVKIGSNPTEGHGDANNLTISDTRAGITIRSASDNYGNIYFSDATSGAGEYAGYIQYNHSANRFVIGTNSADEIVIQSGGGISFNGEIAAANALDDYEEGVHLATVVGSTSGSWTTTSYRYLQYVKIGRLVHIQGYLNITADNSASGDVRISLPFTVADDGTEASENGALGVGLRDHGSSNLYNVIGAVQPGTSTFELGAIDGSGSNTWLGAAHLDGTWNIRIGGTYYAA